MEILKCSKVKQEYLLDVQRGGRNIVIQLFHHINEEATDLSPMPEKPPTLTGHQHNQSGLGQHTQALRTPRLHLILDKSFAGMMQF